MKPNLIYVFADQLRYGSLSCHGDSMAHTPNIDRFAAESTDLCNAVSGHPVCAPYRASLFTGKYTTSTGMVINEIRMNTNHRCLAEVLEEGGYETAYIGKWHLYAKQFGNHYNSDNSFIPKGPDRLGFNHFFAAYNFHHAYYGEKAYYHLDSPEKIYGEGYEPDFQTNLAIEKLKELSVKEKPFALFLSLGTPHDPWTADNVPEKYYDLYKDAEFSLPPNYSPENDPYADNWAILSAEERVQLTEWMKIYYGMTTNLDENFGRLMDAVKAMGLYDNTIFIFTSDHGEMFGAHGRRAKNIFYEEAIRVPFFIRWHGKMESGCHDICLNSVDIMPTLLGMAGLPIPEEVEGSDLSGCLLRGERDREPEGALLMGTGATAVWKDGHEWRGFRTKKYTYAVYHIDGREYLFDNTVDPYQLNDLSHHSGYIAILEELRQKMNEKMREIGDTFEASSYYRDHWIEERIIKRTATIKG